MKFKPGETRVRFEILYCVIAIVLGVNCYDSGCTWVRHRLFNCVAYYLVSLLQLQYRNVCKIREIPVFLPVTQKQSSLAEIMVSCLVRCQVRGVSASKELESD